MEIRSKNDVPLVCFFPQPVIELQFFKGGGVPILSIPTLQFLAPLPSHSILAMLHAPGGCRTFHIVLHRFAHTQWNAGLEFFRKPQLESLSKKAVPGTRGQGKKNQLQEDIAGLQGLVSTWFLKVSSCRICSY